MRHLRTNWNRWSVVTLAVARAVEDAVFEKVDWELAGEAVRIPLHRALDWTDNLNMAIMYDPKHPAFLRFLWEADGDGRNP